MMIYQNIISIIIDRKESVNRRLENVEPCHLSRINESNGTTGYYLFLDYDAERR